MRLTRQGHFRGSMIEVLKLKGKLMSLMVEIKEDKEQGVVIKSCVQRNGDIFQIYTTEKVVIKD